MFWHFICLTTEDTIWMIGLRKWINQIISAPDSDLHNFSKTDPKPPNSTFKWLRFFTWPLCFLYIRLLFGVISSFMNTKPLTAVRRRLALSLFTAAITGRDLVSLGLLLLHRRSYQAAGHLGGNYAMTHFCAGEFREAALPVRHSSSAVCVFQSWRSDREASGIGGNWERAGGRNSCFQGGQERGSHQRPRGKYSRTPPALLLTRCGSHTDTFRINQQIEDSIQPQMLQESASSV